MSFITTDRKADLESDLAGVLAQISALETAFLNYSLTGTTSYDFRAADGYHKEKFTNPLEMSKVLKGLKAERDYLRRALSGRLVITSKLRQ